MRHAHLLSFASLLAAAVLAAPASAQPAPAPPAAADAASARADDLAHQANDLALRHKWAEAEPLFREAWSLKQSYDISGNLGVTAFALGKYRDAAEYLSFALRHFPANGKPEHRDLLREKLAKARTEVGARTVQVNVPGADIFVDGKSAGTSPLPDDVFLEPGTHTIEARRPGYETATRTLDVGKGTTDNVVFVLHVSPPPPPPQLPQQTQRSVVPGAVLGGVAGAALATGIGLFAAARGKRSSAQSLSQSILQGHGTCVANAANFDARCGQVDSAATTGNTLEHASAGLFAGAGVAAAATLVYFLWPQPSPAASRSGTWRIAPAASSTTFGFAAAGTF